jgi:hypothetical protein
MDWPSGLELPDPLVTITPAHACALGGATGQFGGPSTSGAYPASNRALYIPFRLTRPFTVKTLFAVNGATASGNIDVGVYDSAGTRLVSSGSTAQAGTNAIQEFDVADTLLGVGQFYLALAMDNTTGTLFRVALSHLFLIPQGVAQQAAAFPLPATATFAQYASTYLPMFGACARTVV